MHKGRSKRKTVERRGLNPCLWTWKRSKSNKWKWNGHPRNKDNGNPVNGTRVVSTAEVLSPLNTHSGRDGRLARKDYSKEARLDTKSAKLYYRQVDNQWMQECLGQAMRLRQSKKKEGMTVSNWSRNQGKTSSYYTVVETSNDTIPNADTLSVDTLSVTDNHDHILSALECQCDVLRWRSLRCSSVEEARERIEKGKIHLIKGTRTLDLKGTDKNISVLKEGSYVLQPNEGRMVDIDTWKMVSNVRKSLYTDPRNAMVSRSYRCVNYRKGIRVLLRRPYDNEVYYPLGTRPTNKT